MQIEIVATVFLFKSGKLLSLTTRLSLGIGWSNAMCVGLYPGYRAYTCIGGLLLVNRNATSGVLVLFTSAGGQRCE